MDDHNSVFAGSNRIRHEPVEDIPCLPNCQPVEVNMSLNREFTIVKAFRDFRVNAGAGAFDILGRAGPGETGSVADKCFQASDHSLIFALVALSRNSHSAARTDSAPAISALKGFYTFHGFVKKVAFIHRVVFKIRRRTGLRGLQDNLILFKQGFEMLKRLEGAGGLHGGSPQSPDRGQSSGGPEGMTQTNTNGALPVFRI